MDKNYIQESAESFASLVTIMVPDSIPEKDALRTLFINSYIKGITELLPDFQQQLRDLLSEYLYQPLDSSDIDQICNVLTIE